MQKKIVITRTKSPVKAKQVNVRELNNLHEPYHSVELHSVGTRPQVAQGVEQRARPLIKSEHGTRAEV